VIEQVTVISPTPENISWFAVLFQTL